MPGSQITSVVSSTSIGSRYSRRYRTKSKQSSVDEALFGNTKPTFDEPPKDIPNPENKRKSHKGKQKREKVQVITKDLIRDCLVPNKDPSGLTVVLKRNKFAQVLKNSRFVTREELIEQQNQLKKEKIKALEESQVRKYEIKEKEMNRRVNAKLNELEQEAENKANYLLTKANEQRLEQEDEIKCLNELILNAKCQAIRDAQVVEKQTIKGELEEEEMRLDTMMEIDRINGIKAAEEIEEMRKKQRYLGAKQLLTQIDANMQEKILDQEKRDQETKIMLKKIQELHLEDVKEMKERKAKQKKLRAEIEKINEDQQAQRERNLKQEKLADFQVLQYMKKKAERDAEFEAEQLRIRKEKEYETARLRSLQEKAKDHQAEQDALRAKRNQEEAEREWRRKEQEELLKKMKTEEMMRKAREEQVQSKEHFQAVQAQRERAEFERVLKEQQRQIKNAKEREEVLHQAKLRNADEVRQQIRNKEIEKLEERKTHFEEGIRMEEEARLRRVRLNEIKSKKLKELRNAGIPVKYCAEIERKLKDGSDVKAC